MNIADYFLIITPGGLPLYSNGIQKIQKDPVLLGGFLKAIDVFSKEELSSNAKDYAEIKQISWEGFSITLCNPMWEIWEESSNHKSINSFPILATLNLSGRNHLQDPTILRSILQYLFPNKELLEEINSFGKLGQINPQFSEKLDKKVKKLIFGDFPLVSTVDGLIISIGTSWGSIFSAMLFYQPDYTIFIGSEESLPYIQKIVTTFGLIFNNDYEVITIEPDDVSEIAKAAFTAHNILQKKLPPNSTVIINATGGTKSITTGVSHYGFVKQLPISYIVSHKYREILQDGYYGDEESIFLENPMSTVGFTFEKQALELFNSRNFSRAKELFFSLSMTLTDLNNATYFEGLGYLADAYWYQIHQNYSEALSNIKVAYTKLSRFCNTKTPQSKKFQEMLTPIAKQEILIQKLQTEEVQSILYFSDLMNHILHSYDNIDCISCFLQCCFLLNRLLDYLITQNAQIKNIKINLVLNQTINDFIALKLKTTLLKKKLHPFIQKNGAEQLDELIKIINKWRCLRLQDVEEKQKQISQLIQKLRLFFLLFLEQYGSPEAKEDFEALNYLKISQFLL